MTKQKKYKKLRPKLRRVFYLVDGPVGQPLENNGRFYVLPDNIPDMRIHMFDESVVLRIPGNDGWNEDVVLTDEQSLYYPQHNIIYCTRKWAEDYTIHWYMNNSIAERGVLH